MYYQDFTSQGFKLRRPHVIGFDLCPEEGPSPAQVWALCGLDFPRRDWLPFHSVWDDEA